MPPLASSVIDQEGLRLIRDWIRGLPVEKARGQRVTRRPNNHNPVPTDFVGSE